ncbi:sensor histidine kinase [Aurantivibrio plasticivorans]
MQTPKITIVAPHDSKLGKRIQELLVDDYSPEWIEQLTEISSKDIDKPLIQPPKIIIYVVCNYDIDTVISDLTKLTSKGRYTKNHSILYVGSPENLPSIKDYIEENDDVIDKAFQADWFRIKLKQIIERTFVLQKLTRDLREASDIALLSMSHSSELGEISRFILTSYNCKHYEELINELFKTVEIFNIKCSALVVVDDQLVVRLADDVGPEARNTMLNFHDQRRIQHFGKESLISFTHSSLMFHNMPIEDEHHYGRLLDNLTVLGNCFEARVKGIHAEDEAHAASKAKTMFLASMSHELRTPMNSVIGFTERLISKLEGRLNEKEERHLHAIKRNGDHLLTLINDILDLSKIEVGKMEIHPEPIDPVELVTNVYTQLLPIAKKNQLQFSFNVKCDSFRLVADPTRFTQMVMNLASNAIKYTPAGSVTIELDVGVDDDIGECVRVAVADTGIGISEEDQKKLFGNFIQIDSELSRKVEGTGLGLAISMLFANMHGGRVDVTSEAGVGSCFTLVMPNEATRPLMGNQSADLPLQ